MGSHFAGSRPRYPVGAALERAFKAVQRGIDDLLEKGKQTRDKNPDLGGYLNTPLSKPTVTMLLESAGEGEAGLLVYYRT